MSPANYQSCLAPAALLLIVGCSPTEVACTEIGAPPGIAVTVEKAIAADVEAVRLTLCWDAKCDDYKVQLFAGSDTVDQGCDGNDPNSACSATVVPNGTKVGFAEVPGLPTCTDSKCAYEPQKTLSTTVLARLVTRR
jgi:hypothetical protein